MDWDKVTQLLDKYFEAETSLEEEAYLKKAFARRDIPEHMKQYRPLFVYFNEAPEVHSQTQVKLPAESHWRKWLSLAAAFLLFFSVYSVLEKQEREKEEALAAYNETVRALDMIASNLNKGNKAIYELNTFNKTKNKIFKNNK